MRNCTIDAGRTVLVLRVSMNELNYKPLGYRSQFYGEVLVSFSHKLHHSLLQSSSQSFSWYKTVWPLVKHQELDWEASDIFASRLVHMLMLFAFYLRTSPTNSFSYQYFTGKRTTSIASNCA